MARTTRAEVAEIIELDGEIVPNDAAMLPFITVANELVTERCTGIAGPATAYSDERLALIERYLAAHFYTNRDPRVSNEGASGISVAFQSKIDLGLATSHYGQSAMLLDTNGGLAALNKNAKTGVSRVGVSWVGTPYDDIPNT